MLLLGLVLPLALACVPNTADLQALLTTGGKGYVLSLCPDTVYSVSKSLNFTAPEQEISTEGYPTDGSRATLRVVGGTCAVRASGDGLDGVRLRYVQVDGNRVGNASASGTSQGNIEVGGNNRGQLVEWVRSFNPRGWTCLHVTEGTLKCTETAIQHNDIGPCGHDTWQDWADGISLSCANSTVYNNTVVDATDGGIVIFGAPYSIVHENRIRAQTRVMLGGINLVDVLPWKPGNYSGTRVLSNRIEGGYATSMGNDTRGPNEQRALIKIGIGIGPRVWWDETYQNTSRGGEVANNVLSGAFTFGVAVGGAQNFQITNNTFVGNETFIGQYGPNCTQSDKTPNPPVALLREPDSLTSVNIAKRNTYDWVDGRVQGLTCFVPPAASEWAWPYGGGGVNADPTTSVSPTPTAGVDKKGAAANNAPAAWLLAVAGLVIVVI
ncbi:hypothetical protein CcaverHIS002_0607270 [Cutaneotrichosporon cavernicola]|uniref:Right handed beta helix domain-containing protein n=1 Tax=Cutaneotrichosporon cavernicola TaxID=279322 RepID=A0AA48L957_9TREE|nr:uncharacterized protein CcaverHIS019_0606690 [Cutaneotrichosporon cavernicola]BEI86440.1 hypothetical protein CcaverHIS002_0607270 [Cutaneotrichosporon cavernicola]BEI94210.1 hypothetical protein CcaverHIS019_0606690 [Cutaneotrichosporon cavernicola]